MLFREVAAECEFLLIMQDKKQWVVASSRKKYLLRVVNVFCVSAKRSGTSRVVGNCGQFRI